MEFFKGFWRVANAKHRSHRYRVGHETLNVMRFSGPMPSKVKGTRQEIFHRRSTFKTAVFGICFCALIIWTFTNYVKIFQSMG
ncbi:hypothetical protein GW916_11225 [bacterium]|nr:hypothetical protein [bacterium]